MWLKPQRLRSRQTFLCWWPEINILAASYSSTTQSYQQADNQRSISRTAAQITGHVQALEEDLDTSLVPALSLCKLSNSLRLGVSGEKRKEQLI